MNSIIFFLLLIPLIRAQTHPCKLEWRSQSVFSPLPDDAVPTHGSEHFVSRIFTIYTLPFPFQPNLKGMWSMGRVTNSTGDNKELKTFTNIPNYLKPILSKFIQVLTNPNDCLVEWIQTLEGGRIPEDKLNLVVNFRDGGSDLVARVPKDNIQIAGSKDGEWVYSVNFMDSVDKDPAMVAQVMISSINLRIEMSKFTFFDIVDDGDADVFGMDMIVNEADVEINQTVRHRKTVIQKYSFQESTSFSKVTAWSVSVSIPIMGVTLSASFSKSNTEANTDSKGVSHEEEHEVVSLRTILVPPYGSVEACSFSNFNDGAELPFEAEGKYTIKGLAASEVRKLLVEAGIPDIIREEGNAVVTKVTSSMRVSIPTKTSFYVTNIGDPDGCTGIVKRLSAARQKRIFA